MSPKSPILLAFALLAFLAALGPSAREVARRAHERPGALSAAEDLEKRNSNAFAMILGEVRASAADLMFTKTERYLHYGVAYKPHMEINPTAVEGGAQEAEHDENVPTIIRAKADDFRGFLGDLERAVKPFRDPSKPHELSTGEELLPWYRLMTLADPHYLRGYMLGAMWLEQDKQWRQARQFLEEGIAANPQSPELWRLEVAYALLFIKTRYFNVWGDWLDRALDASNQAFSLGLQQRPEGGKEGAIRRDLVWRVDLEEDFRLAGRWRALLLRERGDNAGALAAALEFQQLAPDDTPIQDLINELKAGKQGSE
ncbi:MAG: hypothetical protein NTW86_17740 [Candidatus Sumerlaeota bacterium]|nr:hypothetical protein [Candidatus Sumerlaeota bacterium]